MNVTTMLRLLLSGMGTTALIFFVTLALSLPSRYLHSPNCVVSKSDCEAVLALARELANLIAGGKLSVKENKNDNFSQ